MSVEIPYAEHQEYVAWIDAGRPTEGADTSNLFIRLDLEKFEVLKGGEVDEYQRWVAAGRDRDGCGPRPRSRRG